ncbi:hypothetical protein QM467_15760 [Rhodoblastus sp. 17X3]|uniref:hypothetical protein n=1 Tax=Rhodoblastus sp. 17X3 TaxID=3047026 RepID=UPI0024B6CD3B|nr:hypothetical protein [Rhodoblastus sp. 17X3]MDI9849512.1 hypothetical protein [Rhodoblastus sp. 17X3]
MRDKKSDRTFPALHLAEAPEADDPAVVHMRMLEELAGRLDQYNVFAKGQFVMWKPGLKNRKFPDYGEPAIVTAVLVAPIFDPSENAAGSPYFQELLSLVIGVFCDDDFVEYRVDGRRFEPVEAGSST